MRACHPYVVCRLAPCVPGASLKLCLVWVKDKMIIVQLEVERSHQRIRQEKIDRRKSLTCACNMYSNGTASVLICFSPDYFSIIIDNLKAVSFRTSSTGDDDTSGIHKPALRLL